MLGAQLSLCVTLDTDTAEPISLQVPISHSYMHGTCLVHSFPFDVINLLTLGEEHKL
jgi:hypothetical protein